MDVLAVAESDAYVKWAAWLLDRAPSTWRSELCLVDSVISPSTRQLADALVGTGRSVADTPVLGALAVRRRVLRERPDVLLVAATGRTVAAIEALLVGHPRPVVVAGIPGVALPVRDAAVRSRRNVDVFVTHSLRERDEFSSAFRGIGASTAVAVARLPFLTGERLGPPPNGSRPIFAAQPSVPPARPDRMRVLARLAACGPPAPIVKLRGAAGEMATHDEPFPYPELWAQLVATGEVPAGSVDFATGPLATALTEASCLVTISSTAALEAIDRGRPVLLADDFGVNEALLNGVFDGSGLLAPICREAIERAGGPRPEWAARNYFHPASDEDWIASVTAATDGRGANGRDRRQWDVGDRRDVRQGIVRLAAGRWRRRART